MSFIYRKAAAPLAALCLVACGCSQTAAAPAWQSSETSCLAEPTERECKITLGAVICVSGRGAWFDDSNTVSIMEGGTYILTGCIDEGTIRVDTCEPVRLIFDGASISNDNGFAVLSNSDELDIETRYQSDIKGFGGDYGAAVYSGGKTLFTGEARIDIYGGVYSEDEIDFDGVCANLPASAADGGTLITGDLVIDCR